MASRPESPTHCESSARSLLRAQRHRDFVGVSVQQRATPSCAEVEISIANLSPATQSPRVLPVACLQSEELGYLFVAQAIDGVKVGRHPCGIITEEQAYSDGDREAD